MIEIPLGNEPEQKFSVTINEIIWDFRVLYNLRYGVWTLDISKGGEDIVLGITMLSGINIIDQYRSILDIDNMWMVNLDDNNEEATVDNLGVVAKLFVLTSEELNNV